MFVFASRSELAACEDIPPASNDGSELPIFGCVLEVAVGPAAPRLLLVVFALLVWHLLFNLQRVLLGICDNLGTLEPFEAVLQRLQFLFAQL